MASSSHRCVVEFNECACLNCRFSVLHAALEHRRRKKKHFDCDKNTSLWQRFDDEMHDRDSQSHNFFKGSTGEVFVHVLSGGTPFPFPRPLMERFELVTDNGRKKLHWDDSSWTRVHQRSGGHHLSWISLNTRLPCVQSCTSQHSYMFPMTSQPRACSIWEQLQVAMRFRLHDDDDECITEIPPGKNTWNPALQFRKANTS